MTTTLFETDYVTTALSFGTALTSVASGGYSVPSGLVANTYSGGSDRVSATLVLHFSTSVTAGAGTPAIALILLSLPDGSTYPRPPGNAAASPSPNARQIVRWLSPSVAYSTIVWESFDLEPGTYAFMFYNNSGVAWSGGGTITATLYRFGLQQVASATGATRAALIGFYNESQVDSPPLSATLGYYPDFTINHSYVDPTCGAGDQFSANNGYPFVIANSHYAPSESYTAAGAAANSYLTAYTNGLNTNVVPYANKLYAFRLDREWGNPDWEWSPYSTAQGGSYTSTIVDPATWIAGFQNYANLIRSIPALSQAKIAWDYPCMIDSHSAVNPMSYYPGDAYVDIISCDIYFVSEWYGGTSQSCWNFYATYGSYNLGAWAAFASAHNKPMAVWEWGENYGDGYCITQFGQWIKGNNVVAHAYWDNSNAYSNGPLYSTQANINAFVTQFGNTTYNGTYWPSYFSLPATKPPGF